MKLNTLIIVSILGLSAIAASAVTPVITSTPLVKVPFDAVNKALYVTADGAFGCPDGFDLYVRAVKPKDPKAPQGDYNSFYFAKSADAHPPVIVSRPDQQFVPACFEVK